MKNLKENEIYLNNYYLIKDYIFNNFIKLSSSNIFRLSSFTYPFIDNQLYLINEDESLHFVYKNSDIIKTNTQIIDLTNSYNRFIENVTGLKPLEGKNKEDNFILNCFINNQNFNLVFSYVENKDNYFIGHIIITNEIVFTISALYDSYHFINHDIFPYDVGIIIVDHEKEGVKDFTDKVIDNLTYKFIKADFNLTLKEQYSFLDNEIINFIIVFNHSLAKKNECKIKDIMNDDFTLIEVDKVNEFIDSRINDNFNKIKNTLFKENVILQKEKCIELCSSCLNKENNNIFLPLNQRLKINKCLNCNNKSVYKIIRF